MHHIVSKSNLMARWSVTSTYFCVKINQKSSKIPIACDFTAISGSVDSTTSLANGFYVPHMV